MRYIFLIYGDPKQPDSPELGARYIRFTQDVVSRGVMRAGDQLHRSHTATIVRVRNGKTLTTDGPYAETKEQIGGYFILDCKHLDEAIELASKIPNAEDGCIEVRQIMEHERAG